MKRFLLLFLVLVMIFAITGCSGSKIDWDSVILGDILPEPPSTRGEVHSNTSEDFWAYINKVSEQEYNSYIQTCKNSGFTVDPDVMSSYYTAYNQDGYKLSLSYSDYYEQLSIKLDAPMQMSAIAWPTSTAGKLLPVPKSTVGKFSYEYEDSFFVYIANTTKEDYIEYVNACSAKGFNIDYNKGDKHYFADNNAGWQISIRYQGYNIMSIGIDPPKKESSSTTTPTTSGSGSGTSNNSSLDPNFKAAMDSYETFMNEYVTFMKKYKANPTDMTLLSSYADYMSKYAQFASDFAKWEDTDLNAAELAYYAEVQARVSKKLLEVA